MQIHRLRGTYISPKDLSWEVKVGKGKMIASQISIASFPGHMEKRKKWPGIHCLHMREIFHYIFCIQVWLFERYTWLLCGEVSVHITVYLVYLPRWSWWIDELPLLCQDWQQVFRQYCYSSGRATALGCAHKHAATSTPVALRRLTCFFLLRL